MIFESLPDAVRSLRRGASPERTALLLGYLFVVVVAAGAIAVTSLNHDVGDFLLEARGFAEGRRFIDMNMPTNIWAPSISLGLSRHLPFYLADVHQSLLFAYALICTSLTAFQLWPPRGPDGPVRCAAIIGVTAILLVLPGYDFGQREHLFVLSCAPLLALLYNSHAGRAAPPWLSVVVAATAAFGASQKPFFIVFLGILGGLDLALNGFRRISHALLLTYAFTAACLVWIFVAHPDYFTDILPRAIVTYGSLRLPLSEALLLALVVPAPSVVIFILTIVVVKAALKYGPRRETLPHPFLFYIGAALAAWSLAVLQRMSFDYHFLPFKLITDCGSVIAVAWLSTEVPLLRRAPRWIGYILPLAYAVALLFQPTSSLHHHFSRRTILDDAFTRTLQALPPKTPILMLSLHLAPITPAHAYADIRWTGLYPTLFELEPIFRSRREERNPAMEAAAADIRKGVNASFFDPAPGVVFVEVSEGSEARDLIRFLSEDAAFREIWSAYKKTGEISSIFGRVDRYERN